MKVGFWIAAVLGVLGGMIYLAHQDDAAFDKRMQTEYATCIGKKESEYTCKAYIASMQAQRSADEASTMAIVGISMGAANAGNKR